MMSRIFFFICCVLIFASCSKQPPIDDSMLDGNSINDPSIAHPELYLTSYMFPNPTAAQKQTPVLIAVHGYSATTFEWDELRAFADTAGGFYVSQVLLGGHGRDYSDFKNASWSDWQKPIIDEYERLSTLGFTNISIVGSSTGCPLVLEMIYSGKISNYVQPQHVMLIDPIIISSDKTLTLVDYVGPALNYIKTQLDPGEEGHWYQYRPHESLEQLLEIITKVRKKLEDGITLPGSTTCKVYKAKSDGSADPVSAVLLYEGMQLGNGSSIDVEMENSSLHVFTRLQGRSSFSASDRELQINTFRDFKKIITQ